MIADLSKWEKASSWLVDFTTILLFFTTVIVILYILFLVSRAIQLQLYPEIKVMKLGKMHKYFWKSVGIAYAVSFISFSLTIVIPAAGFILALYLAFRAMKVIWVLSGKKI